MLSYILCCECVLLLLNRHTAANTVSSMAVLSTAPMIPPPTHGSGELDPGVVLTGLASVTHAGPTRVVIIQTCLHCIHVHALA